MEEEWGGGSWGMVGWVVLCALHTCGIVAWIIWSWQADQAGRSKMPVVYGVAIANIFIMVVELAGAPMAFLFEASRVTIS